MIYKPVDPSLALYVDGQKSRRQDNNVTNLATNPDQKRFPCLSFDGVDDYVVIPDNDTLTSNTFTFAIEFQWNGKRSASSDWMCLLSKGFGSGEYTILMSRRLNEISTNINFYINGAVARVAWPNSIIDTAWHQLIVTYDKINATIYFDGQYKNSASYTASVSNTTNDLQIGLIAGASTYPCGGMIKKVLRYNRALSAPEASAMYNNGDVDPTGLVGQWLFNEGTGSTVIDASGNGNNGTIYGAIRQDGKTNGTLVGDIAYKNSPTGKSVLSFDGTDDYIRHPTTDNYSSNLSCFIWAKGPFQSYLIGRHDTGFSDRGWLIGTDQANETRMRVLLSSTGAYSSTTSKDYLSTADVFDDNWHLYGFSWGSGVLRLFVDGREQAVTKTYDAAFTSIYKVKSDIIVGARIISNVPSGFYTGQVGEYYIYKRTVSPSGVSILYNDTRRFYGR